jgi:hypothetical protein
LLKYFQQVSFFFFHTWVHNISTILPFLHPFLTSFPLPLVPTQCCTILFSIFTKKTFCLRELYSFIVVFYIYIYIYI